MTQDPSGKIDFEDMADQLEDVIADYMNSDTYHVYKPGSEHCPVQEHIEQALRSVEKRTVERMRKYLKHNCKEKDLKCLCGLSEILSQTGGGE